MPALWRASDLVDEHIGDEPVAPLAPRIAVRAAEHEIPAGLVAALDAHLRTHAAGDRLEDVLIELDTIRIEAGWPPLAPPIGQILGSQALLHVLSARRYVTVTDELRSLLEGRYGTPPGPIDPIVRRAVELQRVTETVEDAAPVDLSDVREQAEGSPPARRSCSCSGCSARRRSRCCMRSAGAREPEDSYGASGVDRQQAERIRELVRIVQESGVAEIEIEEDGMRVSVRRTEEPLEGVYDPLGSAEPELAPVQPLNNGFVRVEAPMVGTFYRAAQPGVAAFVEVGDAVAPGETLCILEAMKLMNEVKAEIEGIVRAIHVDDAQPVEFGQLLFELERIGARPLDAV